jgi:biotin transport system substrate-specific component
MIKKLSLRDLTYCSLFAALISIMGYVTIPLPAVPITGQTLAIMMTGSILSPYLAGISVLIFLLLGAIGIPVFSNGSAGFGVLAGPTGGYLVGFLIGVIIISLISKNKNSLFTLGFANIIGGILVIYGIGVPWLNFVSGIGIERAFMVGAVTFLPGDIIKVFIATPLAWKINRHLKFQR